MTCAFQDESPIIFNGKPLKSVNWHYNKRKSYLQSKLPKGRKTSKMIDNISLKRNNRVSDYLHKITSMFINYAVSKGISDVVVGYNKEWKQGINIGRVNNQNFVGIPYYKLLNMLTYKCELHGISLTLQKRVTQVNAVFLMVSLWVSTIHTVENVFIVVYSSLQLVS